MKKSIFNVEAYVIKQFTRTDTLSPWLSQIQILFYCFRFEVDDRSISEFNETRFKVINLLLLASDFGLRWVKNSNLVDPASSHTLVSRIKPCMSNYKWFIMKLQMLIQTVIVYLIFKLIFLLVKWITVVILKLIHSLGKTLQEPSVY